MYPAEIERVLLSHPTVSEAAVVAVPDERWGEAGRAFVVLRPNQTATETELLDFCRERLAKFKVPRSVVFLPELPKNDTGKIKRQALGNSP